MKDMRRKLLVIFFIGLAKILSLIAGFGDGVKVYGQTIEYSRQNFRAPIANAVRLVTGIAGKHHILSFTSNKNVFVNVYNDALQLLSRKEVAIRLHENDDVNVVPFKSFYFLYIHQQRSSKHELLKIDAEGNATSFTGLLAPLIDSAFRKHTTTLQMEKIGNRLSIIGNLYYEDIEKVCSVVVETDEQLNIVRLREVFFQFKQREEYLRQVVHTGNDLIIMKTSTDSGNHLLQVIKANLNTGDIFFKAFSSGINVYSNPAFSYVAVDSSIIIYSMVRSTVFITKLNYALKEKVPVTLLKNQFTKNTAFNFLLLPEQSPKWLRLFVGGAGGPGFSPPGTGFRAGFNSEFNNSRYNIDFRYLRDYGQSRQGAMGGVRTYFPGSNYNNSSAASGIRFNVLHPDFTISKDSVVANDDSKYNINPAAFANVVVQGKSYLFLMQQFGNNRQGLLMVYMDSNGELATKEIRVYEKHEYLLQQLQVVNNKSVILPYTYKRELGLVRITLQ
jgi:hypothetical protein